MSPSRENMFEAFKDAHGKGDAGGPFAAPPSTPRTPSPPSSGGGGIDMAGPARVIVAAAGLGLAFVAGVAVGRGTAGEADTGGEGVHASERSGPFGQEFDDPPAPLLGTDGGPGSPGPEQGDVEPLQDPRNKYTVLAISVTRSNEDIAWINYDHLKASGLPVFRPFVTGNGMLAIVVGAAPKESELHEILSRLKRLPGPNGTGRPYEGAYTNAIRKLIPSDG